MKKISLPLQGWVLLALAGIYLVLIFGGHYQKLLHPKFMPLSAVSALVLAAMGLVSVAGKARSGISAIAIVTAFVLTFLLAAVPLLHGSAPATNARVFIGDRVYIPINVIELFGVAFNDLEPKNFHGTNGTGYLLRGFIYRNSALDRVGEFALMRGVMSCCYADATAYGFRVVWPSFAGLKADSWVKVYGRLAKRKSDRLDRTVDVASMPNTLVHDRYFLIADRVETVRAPESFFILEFRNGEPYSY